MSNQPNNTKPSSGLISKAAHLLAMDSGPLGVGPDEAKKALRGMTEKQLKNFIESTRGHAINFQERE